MFRLTRRALFLSQRDTPIIPQRGAWYNGEKAIHVGYLLCRMQSIRPDPHPMEQEMTYQLEQEYNRYARHSEESPSQYLKARNVNLDQWGREDSAIRKNFFNLESYVDVHRTMLSTWSPGALTTEADHDPARPRKTLARALSDNLFLITKTKDQAWSVPYIQRKDGESLRMTLERLLYEHHGDAVQYYVCSNAPAGHHLLEGDKSKPVFVFHVNYIDGMPTMEPTFTDHAWVTRQELLEYSFVDIEMKRLLYDITMDGTGDAIEMKVETN